jgi:aryl sulfotransferase
MRDNIVWLASYPKSGNTWLRIFLANLVQGNNDFENPIINLPLSSIASNRRLFDEAVGYPSSDLYHDEIAALRSTAYQYISPEIDKTYYMKIHDAYQPSRASQKAIYLIRNPLDVVVSFAAHRNRSIDETLQFMSKMDAKLARKKSGLSQQLCQPLLSWRRHVLSWVDNPDIPVHVVRYEDMLTNPLATFTGVIVFLGLSFDSLSIQRAFQLSDFEHLKKYEAKHGFNEKSAKAKCFFRQGQSGGWRSILTERQVASIRQKHADVMRRFGYLNRRTLGG